MEQCTHEHTVKKLSRKELLGQLEIGDIFYAVSEGNGAQAICLVRNVDNNVVISRRITTQECCRFDRETDKAIGDVFPRGMIKSVEPLPAEILNTFLEMDRQYRLGHIDEDSMKLTASQKAALLFIADFYARYPIAE